uniref:Uncharacterized protein n=1 Tax=Equus caballus TaxID=9796 RepID=A0A3Q2LLT7_HORSE
MMKLWLPPRNLPNPTNLNRPIPSHTLHIRHNNRFLIHHPYLPRCQLRMNYPLSPCQRSIHTLYLSLHPRRMRPLLRCTFTIPSQNRIQQPVRNFI